MKACQSFQIKNTFYQVCQDFLKVYNKIPFCENIQVSEPPFVTVLKSKMYKMQHICHFQEHKQKLPKL